MKLLHAIAAVLLGIGCAAAQEAPPTGYSSVELLWPAGHVPGAHGTAEADVPRLYCYPAAGVGPHAAVVLLPGGGYIHLVMEKEAAAEARWLNARGVSAYILQYRLSPAYTYPAPLLDGARAVRLVRAHARDWGLRPDAIGVWGFSAGGHMAGYLATSDVSAPPGNAPSPQGDAIDAFAQRPDFAIISYGRLSVTPDISGSFRLQALIGEHPTQAVVDAVSPLQHVTRRASQTFLYATEGDEKVSALNATLFFNALQKAGVPAELHVFEQGPHGTGMGEKYSELSIWPLLLEHWMQLHEWMPASSH